MDIAEEILINNEEKIKPKTVITSPFEKFQRVSAQNSQIKTRSILKSSRKLHHNDSFTEMEKICGITVNGNSKINKLKHLASPLSEISNMLKETQICEYVKKPNNSNNVKQVLSNLQCAVQEGIKSLQSVVTLIKELENEIEPKMSNAVENKQNLSVIDTRKFKIPADGSPTFNEGDLRKSLLKKTVQKSVKIDAKSPNSMYNKIRQNCTILCTPKIGKKVGDTPRRALSKKIQEQCCLLEFS